MTVMWRVYRVSGKNLRKIMLETGREERFCTGIAPRPESYIGNFVIGTLCAIL